MTTAKEDFKKWFVDPLAGLKENGHAGFILLLVAFPLLERYLRNKSGCPEGNVTGKFHSILEVLFRDIAGKGGLFWNCYRHGLLHQATFNIEKKQKRDDGEIVISILPAAGIS